MAIIAINMDSLNPKSFKKTVRHKVKDGLNTFRFLPPFGEESNGYPYRKWNIVWGLIDPNSGRARPFASSSTYEGQCPVFDYLELLKGKLEGEKIAMLAKGSSEDDFNVKFKAINDFISGIRPKTVFAYNASDKSGTVGVLELKTTAHKDVLKVMNQYIKDYNQDPTSLGGEIQDSGLWMNVTREGEGFKTTYGAAKNQIMVKNTQGIPQYQDDRTPLAENISASYESLAYDLNTIYQKLTYDELKEILVANIIHSAETMPELLVEGFGLGEVAVATSAQKAVATSQVPITSASKTTPLPVAPIVQGTGVKIKIDTNVDDTDEDLLKMADQLFNS